MAKRFLKQENGPMVMPDLDRAYGGGFVSPVTGEYITSRSQLARHNRANNCRQAGDFKPRELIGKEDSRVERTRQKAKGASFEWK